MIHEQLLKTNIKLLKYDHINIISENKHLSFKAQKDIWVKLWSAKRKKRLNNQFNHLTYFSSCN